LFFYEKIKALTAADTVEQELKNLSAYADCILNMQVVQIIVDKEQEGYDIFEILNARGTPLAQHELLKNYIFKFYKPVGDIDNAKRLWAEMDSTLTINNKSYLAAYVDHYTVHKYQKPDSVNTVLRIIKKANAKNNTKELLQDMYDKAVYYSWLVDPDAILDNELFDNKKHTENIWTVLKYFSLKTQSQFRPLILSLFSKLKRVQAEYEREKELLDEGGASHESVGACKKAYRDCEKEVDEAITYLLHFSIVELVIKKQQPKVFESKTHELAKNIENGNYPIKSIYDILAMNITLDMFVNGFGVLGYSNKSDVYSGRRTATDIRQLLRMYELHVHGTDELTVNNFTIEHIMNDSAQDIESCYIGNLLPISEDIQKDIGEERELAKKMPHYKKSEFETVKEFVRDYGSSREWRREEIAKRTEAIAKVFYNEIFKIPQRNGQ